MRGVTKRQLIVPLVVLTVLLAGCSGGGGNAGDGGSGATATPTEMTQTATSEETAMDTTTGTTGGTTSGGDGGATTTDGGGGATTTAGETTNGDSKQSISVERHNAALQEAGSYTIEYTIEGLMGGSGSSVIAGTEKANLDTGARYATLESQSQNRSFSIEYYTPPDSSTAYRHIGGQTQEVPSSEAFFFNLTNVQSGTAAQDFPKMTPAGTGQTVLGPAKKYVLNSVDALPNSTVEQYGSVKEFSFVVFVDQDTGVIAKYDYQITYVQNGEERTIRLTYEVTDLGSTTVDPPEWAP